MEYVHYAKLALVGARAAYVFEQKENIDELVKAVLNLDDVTPIKFDNGSHNLPQNHIISLTSWIIYHSHKLPLDLTAITVEVPNDRTRRGIVGVCYKGHESTKLDELQQVIDKNIIEYLKERGLTPLPSSRDDIPKIYLRTTI